MCVLAIAQDSLSPYMNLLTRPFPSLGFGFLIMKVEGIALEWDS